MKNFIFLVLLTLWSLGCKKSPDPIIEEPVVIGDTTTIFTDESSEWIITKSEIDTTILAFNLYFINGTTGFLFGPEGAMYKTLDSGKSWKKLTTGTTLPIFSVFFLDEKTGFAGGLALPNCPEEDCGKGSLLLKTTDGGETWSKYFTKGIDGILSINFLNEQTGLAINPEQGGTPHPIMTTDGGITWSKINLWAQLNLFSGPLPTIDSTVYLLGEQKSAFRSTDFGKSWTQLNGLPRNLREIQFFDKNNGFAYTKSSLYKTTDGGDSWTESSLPPSSDGLLIHFFDINKSLSIEPVYTDHPMGLLPVFHGSYIHETNRQNSNWKKSKLYSSLNVNLWHFPDATTGFGIYGRTFYTIKKK